MQTLAAALLLAAVLGFALVRPGRLPEAVVAVPAAVLVVASGLVPLGAAAAEMVRLAPTVGFLAAVLALAHLADHEGVFRYAGAVAARLSRGSPRRLLQVVFVIAALTTATLSLDATVVLLTPVIYSTVATLGARSRPHIFACAHLANSASLLLPVSNLTNLLAFRASGLGFASFSALMSLPWLTVVLVEYLVFRRFFAADLDVPPQPVPPADVTAPRFALTVLVLTLGGFVGAEILGLHPVWAAIAGAAVLSARRLKRERGAMWRIVAETNPSFCAFVFALALVVLAVRQHGLDPAIADLLPRHTGLVQLLTLAAIAALLANLVNNLPAVLLLVPATQSTGEVLAVLIGVNVGPNLTYVGSLATLLWRQVAHRHGDPPTTARYLRLGLLTVPACLVSGVVVLWLVLTVSGTA